MKRPGRQDGPRTFDDDEMCGHEDQVGAHGEPEDKCQQRSKPGASKNQYQGSSDEGITTHVVKIPFSKAYRNLTRQLITHFENSFWRRLRNQHIKTVINTSRIAERVSPVVKDHCNKVNGPGNIC
jgi:hypothetical protein